MGGKAARADTAEAEAMEGEAAGAKAVQLPTTPISANTRLWGCWKGREAVGGEAVGAEAVQLPKTAIRAMRRLWGCWNRKKEINLCQS